MDTHGLLAPPRPGFVRSVVCVGVALYLLLGFFALDQQDHGLFIGFQPPFTSMTPGEAYFWLASVVYLAPAGALLGYGLAPILAPRVHRGLAWLDGVPLRTRALLVLAVGVLVTLLARAGHRYFLRDFPFTDDEWAVEFGGQLLARGNLFAPIPQPQDAFTTLYGYARNGLITSMDYLGVQLVSAFSIITGLGPWAYALLAGATAGLLAWIAGRRHGPVFGAFAAFAFLCSPMAMTLSFTTHAHVVSRCLIAGTILAFDRAEEDPSLGRWSLAGLLLGLGVLARPPEIVVLTLPMLLAVLAGSARGRHGGWKVFAGLALGGALPIATMLAHDWAITGHVLHHARVLSPRQISLVGPRGSFFEPSVFWYRFGAGAHYQLLGSVVWMLGLAAWLLVPPALFTSSRSRRLGAGLLLLLGVHTWNPDSGIHAVGPIHSSDALVPVLLVATDGAARWVAWLRARSLPLRDAAAMLLGALLVFGPVFTWTHGKALRRQSRIHEVVYGAIDATAAHGPSLVLAPPYYQVVRDVPAFKLTDTWVDMWRHPRPDLSDPALIALDLPGAEHVLRQRYPARRVFRLRTLPQRPWVQVDPVPAPDSRFQGRPEPP